MLGLIPILLAAGLIQPSDSTGTIVGHIGLNPGGRPLGYANVIVIGTRRGAQSGEDGNFRIENVPAGKRTVRILMVGYGARSEEVDVRPGVVTSGIEVMFEEPPPVKVGSRSGITSSDLEARIRPTTRFHVGDKPKFEVRIGNRAGVSAVLVMAADSGAPLAEVDIKGPPDGWSAPCFRFCGNTNGVSLADFVDVRPGDSLDPYGHGWLPASLTCGTFKKPGRYTATFHYDTNIDDVRAWMAGPCGDCAGSEGLRLQLEHVAAVKLTAMTTFDVEP